MARPELIYFAAMFLVALPVAWFARSRAAMLVFAVWAFGQTLWLIGLPEPQTQLVLYLAALCTGWRITRTDAGAFAVSLFAPLALVCVCEMAGKMNPLEAWWTIYWIALTQAMSLPFTIDLRGAIRRWRGRNKEGDGMEMRRTVYE